MGISGESTRRRFPRQQPPPGQAEKPAPVAAGLRPGPALRYTGGMLVLASILGSQEQVMLTLMLLPTFLLSLTVHEFAHARTALAFGDTTARDQGRVSLNPLVHLDPIGTLVLVLTGMFGWARPVPVNSQRLYPPRLGDILVSLAGPMSNLGLALLCGLGIHLMGYIYGPIDEEAGLPYTLLMMLSMTLVANVGLAVFNLLPLFPLDGHHITRELLPERSRHDFMAWQMRFGPLTLMALLIGPRLIGTVTRRNVFDPVGWLYRNAVDAALNLLHLS